MLPFSRRQNTLFNIAIYRAVQDALPNVLALFSWSPNSVRCAGFGHDIPEKSNDQRLRCTICSFCGSWPSARQTVQTFARVMRETNVFSRVSSTSSTPRFPFPVRFLSVLGTPFDQSSRAQVLRLSSNTRQSTLTCWSARGALASIRGRCDSVHRSSRHKHSNDPCTRSSVVNSSDDRYDAADPYNFSFGTMRSISTTHAQFQKCFRGCALANFTALLFPDFGSAVPVHDFSLSTDTTWP